MKKTSIITVIGLIFMLAGQTAIAQDPVPLSKLPFSAARKAGNTLYVSGSVARRPDGTDEKSSVEAETRQVMENLGRVLKDHGYSFEDVVSATVYLKDIGDYQEMNKAYASFFKGKFPSRACVGGIELVFDFRVEISVVAYKESKTKRKKDEF